MPAEARYRLWQGSAAAAMLLELHGSLWAGLSLDSSLSRRDTPTTVSTLLLMETVEDHS